MILTKDNLLKFVRENKYTTPSITAENFDTTTMIASAALSELAKDKLISITYLKLSSSPYYYDPRQKESLIEIGEKHFSSYDKDVFLKLKENQVLNGNSLSIQENLAIERIKDFAIPLEILFDNRELKFWVWYLRDIDETRKQIVEALNSQINPPKRSAQLKEKQSTQKTQREQTIKNTTKTKPQQTNQHQFYPDFDEEEEEYLNQRRNSRKEYDDEYNNQYDEFEEESEENQQIKQEVFIEDYFKENYLRLENKQKSEKGISYKTSLQTNLIRIIFDCFFFNKKPNDAQIIKFYTSSQNPKIVFIENPPKKLIKLSENLENLTIVEL